jgi:hypothetical protein
MRVISSLISSLDFKLIIYFVFACNLSSRSGDCVLFPLTIDRALSYGYRAWRTLYNRSQPQTLSPHQGPSIRTTVVVLVPDLYCKSCTPGSKGGPYIWQSSFAKALLDLLQNFGYISVFLPVSDSARAPGKQLDWLPAKSSAAVAEPSRYMVSRISH